MGIVKKLLGEALKAAVSKPGAKPAGTGAAKKSSSNAEKLTTVKFGSKSQTPAAKTGLDRLQEHTAKSSAAPSSPSAASAAQSNLPVSCETCGKTLNHGITKRWFCDTCGARTSLAEPEKATERAIGSAFDRQKNDAEKKAKEYSALGVRKDGDFVFTVSGNAAVITSYTGTKTAVNIPSQIQGMSVAGIGEGAFSKKALTSVTIPASVKSIGKSAFSGNSITSITIPKNVDTVGDFAFARNQLTSITIEDGVKSIGENCFEWPTKFGETVSKITSLSIPASMAVIGNYAFARCRVASVTIPKGVVSIGENAFLGNQLKTLNLPEGLTTIGDHAFEENFLTEVKFPSTLQAIGAEAFLSAKLTVFNFPANIRNIGKQAFKNNLLTTLSIPNGVKIEDGAFSDNNLSGIKFSDGITKIEKNVFSGNKLAGNFIVPQTIKEIGDGAFKNNQLTGVEIRGKTKVGKEAFMRNQINKVVIGSSVVELGQDAFTINKLTGVRIPESVKIFMNTEKTEPTFDRDVNIERGDT